MTTTTLLGFSSCETNPTRKESDPNKENKHIKTEASEGQRQRLEGSYNLSTMPHLYVNRPRRHRLFSLLKDDAEARAQFNWERINTVAYCFGGLLFILGSIFFYPDLDSDIGSYLYFAGSIFYLIVTLHDLAEVKAYARTQNEEHGEIERETVLEYLVVINYLAGTLLFIVGSVLFTSGVGKYTEGAYCFIFGSVGFTAGAAINVLMNTSYLASTPQQLRLTTATGTTYLVGSVLLVVASVPYLWGDDAFHELDAFLATQYLIGSFCFLVGGWCNYGRAKSRMLVLLTMLTSEPLDEAINPSKLTSEPLDEATTPRDSVVRSVVDETYC